MLDRLDLKPVAADRGAEFRRYQMLHGGREGGSISAVPVYEDDACICWSRLERKGDRLPGMESNPRTTHSICKGLLSPHTVTSISIQRWVSATRVPVYIYPIKYHILLIINNIFIVWPYGLVLQKHDTCDFSKVIES